MFTSPEEQARHLLEINERLWRDPAITTKAITTLGDPPNCPPSNDSRPYCVVLLCETGDALETLVRNWTACVYVLGESRTWKWDGLLLTPEGVKPRQAAKPRPAGLRWAVAELGRAYQGMRVRDARVALGTAGLMGMGQELPLIAALHPRWATSMNGETIPFVDAPDLEVAPNGKGEFACAPCLNFFRDNDLVVGLSANDVYYPNRLYGSGSLQ